MTEDEKHRVVWVELSDADAAELKAAIEKEGRKPDPEPVAYDYQKALFRAYYLWQRYWADAESESHSANKRADKYRQEFDAQIKSISYTAPPQREWQRLTDEEIHRAYNDVLSQPMREQDKPVVFNVCRAIEAALREKNSD